MMRRRLRATVFVLAACLGPGSIPGQAATLPTEAALTATALSDERARLLSLLARAEVRAALLRHGVSAEQAAARVAALPDAEVALLQQRIDSMPAGGDVVGVAVFVFLVLLVTDILGLTKIFPFTRSIR